MSHWTLLRAARLGYLAGRGLSVNSIMADDTIAARSERAVRVAASRWHVPMAAPADCRSRCRPTTGAVSTMPPGRAAPRRPISRSRCCGWSCSRT